MQAIVKVLAILDELTDNIKELITYFARINNEIRNLVAEHESQVKKIAQDKANGIQMEDVDYMVRIYYSILQATAAFGGFFLKTDMSTILQSGLPSQRLGNEEALAKYSCPIHTLFHRHHRSHQPRIFPRFEILPSH